MRQDAMRIFWGGMRIGGSSPERREQAACTNLMRDPENHPPPPRLRQTPGLCRIYGTGVKTKVRVTAAPGSRVSNATVSNATSGVHEGSGA